MPYGTSLTALTPALAITGVSVSPASGATGNFTNPVTYTVTAEDGSTQAYTITVRTALNPAKAITGFTIPGQFGTTIIDETAHTITLSMPYGSSRIALSPTITITGASVTPASGVIQNFTNPVTYTVTAADGSTQVYTITVNVATQLAIGDNYGGGIIAYIDGTGLHGLIVTSTEIGQYVTWDQAVLLCNPLVFNGYSDWRLPTVIELQKVYALHVAGFGDFNFYSYWSSDQAYTGWAKYVNFNIYDQYAGMAIVAYKGSTFAVRAVRTF
jgi:hypothetical protein